MKLLLTEVSEVLFQMHDTTRSTWQLSCAAVIEKVYRFNSI